MKNYTVLVQHRHLNVEDYDTPKPSLFDADIEQAVDGGTISYREAIRQQFDRLGTGFDADLADGIENCRITKRFAMFTQLERAKRAAK